MNKLNISILSFLLLLGLFPANAQRLNRIYVDEVTASPGATVQIPIRMENTDEIVGVQFDIILPAEISMATDIEPSNRFADHSVTVKGLGRNHYRVLAFSPSGTQIKGNSGILFSLKANVSTDVTEGARYAVTFSGAALSDADGENHLTASPEFYIQITQAPDLMPTDVSVNKTEINPGETFKCTWEVSNIAEVSTTGGWKEQIYAIDETGENQVLLASAYHADTLAAGARVTRSVDIDMSEIPGIAGLCSIMVKVTGNSDCGEPESLTGNNSARTNGTVNINKMLYLAADHEIVDESDKNPIRFKLTRSGSTSRPEAFSLKASEADVRIGLPATVTIPRNHASVYFYLTANANGHLDDSNIYTFSVSGNDYPETASTIKIADDTQPTLSLTASKDEVTEGECFDLTVELPRTLNVDLPVYLSSDNNGKITVPTECIIPAGSRRVTLQLKAADNDVAELDSFVTIRAAENTYESAEIDILVIDDDMPQISLSFSPAEVSENAGFSSAIATITRTTNIDKAAKLLIMDDSDGVLFPSQKTITLPKGATSAQFLIGVNDDDKLNGDRTYNVTVAVYSSACDCYANETSGGSVTAQLKVLDDDCAHLSLFPSSQAFLEGSDDNIITVSRNTEPVGNLAVTLSSERDEMFQYDHNVVIPDGKTSVEVIIKVLANETSLDSNLVSFKAEAEGMSAGTMRLVITDQTLPDAVVAMNVSGDSFKAGGTTDILLDVTNIGNATLPANTPIDISCTGLGSKHRVFTPSAIGKDDTARIVAKGFVLPNKVGKAELTAFINYDRDVAELLFSNNSSNKVSINVEPAFSVTVMTDKVSYRQCDEVVFSGQASGDAGRNAAINIVLNFNGIIQTLDAKTDGDGYYTYTHRLREGQTGHATVSAVYPSDKSTLEMAKFDVYGLQTSLSFAKHQFGVGQKSEGSFVLSNPGKMAQSGLKIEADPAYNCDINIDCPQTIAAGERITVNYTLTANNVSNGYEFESIPLSVTTAEGTSTKFTAYYYIQKMHGQLYSSTKAINTTMQKDCPRDYPVTIKNIGLGETGKISFALPDMIQTATPSEMPSLAPGDSATVVLRFNPSDDMKLNVAIKGNLGINCSNGDGIHMPFAIVPVSETKGSLKIDVIDEFSYYTEEAPHVAYAHVQVLHPATLQIVAEGTTDANGIFATELDEGWYTLSVDIDNHDNYTDNIIISPGEELSKEIFLPYQAVTYSWTMEETEIEDEYIMETVVKYDVRVPKPIVIITPPSERPEPYSVVPILLTNKGIVNALEPEVSISTNGGFVFEFLDDPRADVLAPGQTMTFYAKYVPATETEQQTRAKAATEGKCITINTWGKYKDPCDKYNGYKYVKQTVKFGGKACMQESGGGGSPGGSGFAPGGVGHPEVWSSTNHGSDSSEESLPNPKKYCDEKKDELDNEPFDLEILPNKDVPEADCSSEPVLNHKLVPLNGKRYVMKGVVTDGASKLLITLDPQTSVIPSSKCDNCTGFEWSISPEYGTLEPVEGNPWEAVYTAPDGFPKEYGDSVVIKACLRFEQHVSANVTFGRKSEVDIILMRPPLILVHGLNGRGFDPKKPASNTGTWTELYKRLSGAPIKYWGGEEFSFTPKYKPFNISRLDYRRTHTRAFHVNDGIVKNEVLKMRRLSKSNGILADKCDIVAHGMGGILARLDIQKYGEDHVNKLITVNTPHAGSELADACEAHKAILGGIAHTLTLSTDIDGLYDLGVESKAIAKLNSYSRGDTEVACHAIATQTGTGLLGALTLGNIALDEISGALIAEPPIGTLIAVLLKFGTHYLDDLTLVGPGDWFVSTESQAGGLEGGASTVLYDGPSHYASPNNYKVRNVIVDLLNSPKVGKVSFGDRWFHPAPRKSNHSKFWALQVGTEAAKDFALNKFDTKVKNELKEGYIKHSSLSAEEAAKKWDKGVKIYDGAKTSIKVVRKEIEVVGNYKTPSRSGESDAVNEQYMINMKFPRQELFTDPLTIFLFGNGEESVVSEDYDIECRVPTTFSGDVKVISICRAFGDNIVFQDTTITIEKTMARPLRLEARETMLEIGESADPDLICVWNDGCETVITPDNIVFDQTDIASYSDGKLKGLSMGRTLATASYQGLTVPFITRVFAPGDNTSEEDDNSQSICSSVTLSFKQTAVMTRQAFRGTLTLNNGNKAATLRDFKLSLEVKDTEGVIATRKEFEITPEAITGFTGELDFTGGWELAPSHNGVASILFIPTKYAAPTQPKDYCFGGSFSYTDPYTGTTVTRTLNPVTLTVNPSPELDLTFFMQRDVFGDDPLTEDVTEPMKPAEFALLVNNVGAGDAPSVRLNTDQPKIISNEKGLAIDFELVSTQLNGKEQSLMLGGSSVTDFGSLKAGEQSYAQWWLQSSLLGHFVKYDVKSTHVSDYGNSDLSLLNKVSIHELIHGFNVAGSGDNVKRAFLVNDIPDNEDRPDQLYLSDGSTADVVVASGASISKENDSEYILNVAASATGWNYGNIADPTNGRQTITAVTRVSDGVTLSADNFWQTDRTLRDNKDPLQENLIHFIDNFSDGEADYRLTFTPKVDLELEVLAIEGIPDNDEIATEPVKEVIIEFNKTILPETFTIDDIVLSCQGERCDLSGITIEKISEIRYKLDLATATDSNGFYALWIQTAGITDAEGFSGSSGKQVSWIQYRDGKVRLTVNVTPEEGGSVSPESKSVDFGSKVTLKAIPAEGYEFTGWLHHGSVYSTNNEIAYEMKADEEFTATFTPCRYTVNIDCDFSKGYVNAGSGIYSYGDVLTLEAVAYDGYKFLEWSVDGEKFADTSAIEIAVTGDMTIAAEFTKFSGIEVPDMRRFRIWPLPLRDQMTVEGPFEKIVSLTMFNLAGAAIGQWTDIPEGTTLDLVHSPAGFYILHIVTDNGTYIRKVIKN